MKIKCKAALVDYMVIRMIIAVASLALVLFYTIPQITDYLYPICVGVAFCMLVYIFYLNRFDLLFIGVENENVHFKFINRYTFYKRIDVKTTKNNITVRQEDDKLLFYIDNEQQAILRKKAVTASDWDMVVSTFAKS